MKKIIAGFAIMLIVIVATVAATRRTPAPSELPNLALTPGAADAQCTVEDICPHLTFQRPPMSKALRTQVYERYGMRSYCEQKLKSGSSVCEVDHLISVELCGATKIENLWPESYLIRNGAHTKDLVENRLHKLVCQGKITLGEAQQAEVSDWIAAYRQFR